MENELSRVVDALPGLVWTALPDGHIDFLNQRWCEYTGLSVDQAYGWGWQTAIHPEDLPELLERWRSILASGESREMEARLRRFDGEYRWFLFRTCPLVDASGQVVKWCGMNTDIEDRRRSEETQRAHWWLSSSAREHHFRSVGDDIPGPAYLITPAGEVEIVNRQVLEYFGATLEELKGRAIADTVHPDDRADVVAAWRRAVETGHPYDVEARLRRADGIYRWFHTHGFPLRDTDGRIVLWYLLQTDVDDRRQAEERLRQSEAYLSEAQRLSHTGSFGWSVATGEIIWSEETFRIFQFDRTTKPTVELIVQRTHPEDRALVQQTIERAAQDGKDFDFEHRLLMPDASIKHLHVIGHAERNKCGEFEFVGAVMEVTVAKDAEERIRQNERELRTTLEAIPASVTSARPDGSVDFVSQSWLDYVGCSREETLGWGWTTTIHPEDLDRVLNNWQAASAAGEPVEIELRHRRPDGKYRWFLARAVPLRDEKRNIVKWYATTFDIDDRKRTEALLAGQKRVLEMVAKGDALPRILDALCRVVEEHSSDILSSFLLLDANGTHLRHGAAPRLPQSYIDAIDGVAIGPTGGSCITAAHRAATVIVSDIAADPLWATYRHLPLAHGLRACWSTPIISSEGKVLGTFAMYFREPRSPTPQDLNVLEQVASLAAVSIKHKQAEESLRRSEAYLAESQRLTHVGSSAFDIATGTIVYLSQEHFRIFGFDPEAGIPSFEAARQRLHPEDRDRVLETFHRAVNERTDFEAYHRLVLPDGTIKYVHVIAHPAFNASGDLVEYVGTVMDVTERRQAAEVLQRSENRFRAMVEKNAEGILLILPDKGIIYASPAVERVLGYTSEELTMQSLIQHVHLDYRQHATDTWNRLLQDPDHVSTAETMLQHKDGSWRWIECTARNLLHDPSVQAVVVNFRDITERKLAQAEHQRLEQRLRQAAKMEAVGRLAGGIAHDFNNVLAGIFAYGEMLVEETPGGSPLKRYARNVLIAATRGRALVEQILGYSRSQRGKRAPVDLGHVVAETLELVRGSLPANIRLEASVPESPLVVMGDATQLHQVVTNLCSNAIQAMSGGGILRVALETTDVSGERTLSHGTLAPGRHVRLTIEDSGSGMDEATLSRIFEPFFTTKEMGQGTGLGLALVYAIVTDAGGAIDVKSAPGQGSTFTIYGPLAEVALAAADDTATPPPRGKGERVLLVDDEASLLAATAEVLSRLGYAPVSFSDGHAALAAFEAAPRQFDVVVTDEVMPGLTGTGLASVLRHRRPDLPIVLVSGYSGPLLTQQALAAGVSELLTKPLQSREIATTLARVLHRIA